MWDFDYQAVTAQGESFNGRVTAESAAHAARQLADQGLEVTALCRVDAAGEPLQVGGLDEQNLEDRAWAQRLSEVISRRHLWLPTLDVILQELPADKARSATEQRLRHLSGDLSIEQFLGRPDGVSLLPLLTSQSEPSVDSLPARRWLEQLYCAQRSRSILRAWWTYPLVLLLITLCMLIFCAVFVLPIFREMFQDFGLTLPAPTKLTFWMADQLTMYAGRNLVYVAVGCLLGIPAVRWWRRRAGTNRLLGRLVAGSTANLRAMSRLTGTLAELLGLDVPLPAALHYAGKASGHAYFAEAAARTAEALQPDSARKAAAVADTPVDPTGRLPQTVIYALAAGTAGRPCLPVLHELAAVYAHVAQLRSARLGASLPIISLLVVGSLVGFVVISLFMPLVSTISSLA